MQVAPVPFIRPPKKEWHDKMEKKDRIVLSDSDESFDSYDSASGSESSSSSESDASSEFSLQKHLADLLPGELIDGMKPAKKANELHLNDLKYVKKKKDKYRVFKLCYRAVKEWRAEERLRRKHHIIKEYEEKIKKFDEQLKKEIEEDVKAHKIAIALEAYRTEQRIKKNSVVKVKQSTLVTQFTVDLQRRDKEKQDMNYYCLNLKTWAQEGFEGEEQRRLDVIRKKEAKLKVEAERAAVKLKAQHIEEDAKILAEDKRLTAEIDTMMVRYGMLEYQERDDATVEENVDNILKRKGGKKKSRAVEYQEREDRGGDERDDPTLLRLSLRNDVDLLDINKTLKRNKHKRSRGKTAATPFKQDLSATGEVTTLKAVLIKETGALSLAAEFTRGACPMLETLNLKDCQIRTEGAGMIFQGAKMANLLNLRELNLRGNFIGPKGVEYMREVCPSGVFLNLRVVNLAENELGDKGLDGILSMIVEGHFTNISEIHLQNNSITDTGFVKLVKIMKSVADIKCPSLDRLGLESNLVSAAAKRKYAPFPHYFSL